MRNNSMKIAHSENINDAEINQIYIKNKKEDLHSYYSFFPSRGYNVGTGFKKVLKTSSLREYLCEHCHIYSVRY